MGQGRSRPWPPWAVGRRGPAVPPSECRTPSRTLGRGPAGARAGPARRTARTARASTASTSACGRA
eukprot:14089733-Alexandrium_andersonii.AAC.1